MKKKSKKKKVKKKNGGANGGAGAGEGGAGTKKKSSKLKISAPAATETSSCVIPGVGEVAPPRTATGVEKVIAAAMKQDPSGHSLVEYYAKTFPPSKFRKILKENINETILLSMIAVATQLLKKSNHDALEQHLKGLARVRRLESTVMFLDSEPKQQLKTSIEDLVGEETKVNALREAFGGSFKW